ncbi:hypothetical protein G7Y79_00027g060850 [Physcia stellaris]|nr:hypothetical protein G7Y79_00027g060850 [Physcia stellaris]
MAEIRESDQDAITAEEIAGGTTVPTSSLPKNNNAFTTLMSPKKPKEHPKKPAKASYDPSSALGTTFLGRNELGAYIASPATFPKSRVLYYNEKFVVINDLYPKSSVHLLLLPRDPVKKALHPFEAFQDTAFLADVVFEVKKLRELAAKELRRRFGKFSAKDKDRNAAMDRDPVPAEEELPPGRDWDKELISGIHAHPSMNHLHIHVISKDHVNESKRNTDGSSIAMKQEEAYSVNVLEVSEPSAELNTFDRRADRFFRTRPNGDSEPNFASTSLSTLRAAGGFQNYPDRLG